MNTVYLIRKLGHVTVYFILTLLVLRGLKKSGIRQRIELYSLALITSFIYAMSDEYHQSLTGFRDGRWSDVGIDSIGIVLAIASESYLNRIKSRPSISLYNIE